tara:strand:- start:711 stop:1226 length:516 start_codon:yes stop_codon:yes gene_type:complete
MSSELNQYLRKQPIYVFKLAEGSTIIAKIVKDAAAEEGLIYVSQPHTMKLDSGKNKSEVIIHEWLYGCDAKRVPIDVLNIIAMSEANLKMKNFYSKVLLQDRLHSLALELGLNEIESDNLTFSDFISSFIDGLEPKDSTEDEDILSPWRDRMEWRPKTDTPKRDEDEDSFL